MPDFDPFSNNQDFSKSSDNKKTNSKFNNAKTTELLKKIIPTIIILAIIGVLVYFLFFNTKEISFDVKNTEGKIVPAQIDIRQVGSTKTIRIASDETIRLNKSKKYTYGITVSDYIAIKSISIDLTLDTIPVILKKNIRLNITSFSCPAKVFLGQTVKCELQLENISDSQDYNLDNLTFEGSVKTWPDFTNKTYLFVDNFGEELPYARTVIGPRKSDIVYVSFNVPTDKKYLGSKTISARVVYTLNKKDTNFTVLESPNVIFTSTISSITKMTSGGEITKTYTIDNSKNKIAISDLKLSIDANYQSTDTNVINSFDVNQAFTLDSLYINVEASDKTTGTITVKIPSTLRKGKIIGTLSLDSPMFNAPKDINFTFLIEEPPNAFEITLSKSSETLDYDVNTNTANSKNIDLILNNKNAVSVHINNISVENSTGTTDCNNLMVVSTLYNNSDIQPNDSQSAPIIIDGDQLAGNTDNRYCAIKIEYIQPFTQEVISILKNITINID